MHNARLNGGILLALAALLLLTRNYALAAIGAAMGVTCFLLPRHDNA